MAPAPARTSVPSLRPKHSQRYLVLGLVGLVELVGLALWLVSGIALNKYRCEYGTLNSMFAKKSSTCTYVKGNTLMMDPAHALTEFYYVHAARSITEIARKAEMVVVTSAKPTRFCGIVMQEWHNRLSHLVSFLLLNGTVSCELMNVSKAQLSHHLAFNLSNSRLFGVELKAGVGLNFTLEQR